LINAFKATLEEVLHADILVHVLDASNPRVHEYNKAVWDVLKELGVDKKPMITALNKMDMLDDAMWLAQLKKDFVNPVAVSAKFGQNLESLLEKVQENFTSRMIGLEVVIPHARMDLVDLFYREGKVEEIKYLQTGIRIKLNIPRILSHKLLHNKEIKIIN
jgi:GTP-binding protein HflX